MKKAIMIIAVTGLLILAVASVALAGYTSWSG
jgi:hypothetical protein